MTARQGQRKYVIWELAFQVLLLVMVFIFFAFERDGRGVNKQVESSEIAFFLNYAIAALFISFVLLPKLLYRNKYWEFALAVLAVIAVVMLVEEGIIEKIYFPDTRGAHFPGVFNTLIGAMPTITILAGFKFAWDALTKQRQVERLQQLVRESELQYLKSQINPHFLFNNLNNLYAHALEKSPKTTDIILDLSEVLRYMLYECKEKYVALDREIQQLGKFINLSQLQLEDKGEVHFDVGSVPSGYRVAPLLLTVFVENAFKHSQSSQSEQIEINIDVDVNESGILHFQCSNTYSEQSNLESIEGGIGLENVKKRLDLLYPGDHELNITRGDGTYTVVLDLKLEESGS